MVVSVVVLCSTAFLLCFLAFLETFLDSVGTAASVVVVAGAVAVFSVLVAGAVVGSLAKETPDTNANKLRPQINDFIVDTPNSLKGHSLSACAKVSNPLLN